MSRRPNVAMTIAGSDSSGGAGVVADLKTFEALGVWGTTAIVAVTAQDTVGVHDAHVLPAGIIRAQIMAVSTDIGIDAAKTGMLATADTVAAVVGAIRDAGIERLVVDPVMVSKHGDPLLAEEAVAAVRDELLPLASVVTPNLPEASALLGWPIGDRAAMLDAARALSSFGPGAVLLKGGHLRDGTGSPDLLWAGGEELWLEGARLAVRHTHGTGCVLSAAITAELARGRSVEDAARTAKRFVNQAIAAGVELGAGIGPVDPGWGRSS